MSLKLSSLGFKYQKSGFALGPIDLEIQSGITCLVGANGAGKSTLFSIITGELRPNTGSVLFYSKSLEAQRNLIGFLPQNPSFPKHATVEDFLYFSGWVRQLPDQESRVESVLQAVNLESKRNSKVKSLSGGMIRRLGIAQALLHDPKILLLDEPTAGLDPKQRLAVRNAIAGQVRGNTTLISTHLVEDVRALADSVVVITNGAIVFQGSIAELEALDDPTLSGETALERAIGGLLGSEDD